MTGQFYLDWTTVAVSLFNTILLFWLGFTVLLNAERRTWGIWLAGAGLLTGGSFFVSHSAILGRGLSGMMEPAQGLDFWWHVGWILVIALPLAWYVMMLWYAGFWDNSPDPERRLSGRPGLRLLLVATLAVGLVGLLFFTNALPPFGAVAGLEPLPASSLVAILPLIFVYPLYIVLCNTLSLGVLRRPGPSSRVMGDLARRRARPWLIGTSVTLLLVSLLVVWVMFWTLLNLDGQRGAQTPYVDAILTVTWFDLAIELLIAVAIILLGQAIVSYEIFTGKTLPRRGFRRYWQRGIILGIGYGAIVGWALTLQLRPIYSFLIATVLITAFYALLSWRSFAERERAIEQLRPFVTSQRLYEQLLAQPGAATLDIDVATPFRALCDDVLSTRTAYLIALGPLAALAGPPLVRPANAATDLPWLAQVVVQIDSPETMCVPLDPALHDGLMWAVPLWTERGLIGVLLLGDKRDGGFYTQEEIEIARSAGARLIDMQAGAEMARRLVALQRQRLAETQVLDWRTRRVLHDDVLPQLHTALLTLSGAVDGPRDAVQQTTELLSEIHRGVSELLREAPSAMIAPDIARLGPLAALQRTVSEELGSAFDEVTWQVEPSAEIEAARLPALTAEVLFYAAREAARNAARHGRLAGEPSRTHAADGVRPLHLNIRATTRTGLEILIEDNGVGLGPRERANPGSGSGLALHSTMMTIVGGALTVDSAPGEYTRVLLTAPREGAAVSRGFVPMTESKRGSVPL